MRSMLLGVLALAIVAGPARAGWDAANAAYQAGDYQTAIAEYRALADAGEAKAQFKLGQIYELGKGVAPDYAAAAAWYRAAADRGHGFAQYSLSLLRYRGDGVAQDMVRAHFWASLAARRGSAIMTDWRLTLEGELTPEQLAESNRLAAAWTPRE